MTKRVAKRKIRNKKRKRGSFKNKILRQKRKGMNHKSLISQIHSKNFQIVREMMYFCRKSFEMSLELGVLFERVVISKNGIVLWCKSKIIKQQVR